MRAYGATETIDRTAVALPDAVRRARPDGIDVLIDLVDNAAGFAALASLVTPGGTAVTTQYVADEDALLASGVTGINFALQMFCELLQRVAEAVVDGRIVVPPITRMALEEAPAYLDPAQAQPVSGKTVITLWPIDPIAESSRRRILGQEYDCARRDCVAGHRARRHHGDARGPWRATASGQTQPRECGRLVSSSAAEQRTPCQVKYANHSSNRRPLNALKRSCHAVPSWPISTDMHKVVPHSSAARSLTRFERRFMVVRTCSVARSPYYWISRELMWSTKMAQTQWRFSSFRFEHKERISGRRNRELGLAAHRRSNNREGCHRTIAHRSRCKMTRKRGMALSW